ncbi:MAG: hypothetical protein ACXWIU_01470 [Limisphaerales bacterium]
MRQLRIINAGLRSLLLPVMAGFLFTSVSAQSVVTVTIDTNAPIQRPIPDDFVGLSFGMRAMLGKEAAGHFFSPSNSPLITLFENVGIKHLRVGGTSVEAPPTTPIPDADDIDNLFRFARAADVARIIYSLRLLETNAALNYEATNVEIAKYIRGHYGSQLDCFAIGNEPDLRRVFDQDYAIRDFGSYLQKWQRYSSAIVAALPEAKFAGPDGSGNVGRTTAFAKAECPTGLLKMVTDHFYVGGKGRDVPARRGIDDMLSAGWIARNEKRFEAATVPVLKLGCAYRLTEANDHYSGGVPDASDTFAGALWALDFLHWWAAHGIAGVDFHNTQWVVNDVITRDKDGELRINPKGYGLKAFAIGSKGSTERTKLVNRSGVNLTAYSVRNGNEHFVTLINKEHGFGARLAKVTIAGVRASGAEIMEMTSGSGGVAAKTGITLGGEIIANDARWNGKWTPVKINKAGQCLVKVAAGSAVIVRVK